MRLIALESYLRTFEVRTGNVKVTWPIQVLYNRLVPRRILSLTIRAGPDRRGSYCQLSSTVVNISSTGNDSRLYNRFPVRNRYAGFYRRRIELKNLSAPLTSLPSSRADLRAPLLSDPLGASNSRLDVFCDGAPYHPSTSPPDSSPLSQPPNAAAPLTTRSPNPNDVHSFWSQAYTTALFRFSSGRSPKNFGGTLSVR